MRDDRGPRTPVAEGTSSPPMTRRSARAAKKARDGDGNVTPRRERARTAPEAASTAPTRARSTDRGSTVTREKGTSRDSSPSTPVDTLRPAPKLVDGRLHSATREARVDTPRPAAKAQGAIYRDENGILRTASAARARALDMPPPAPRMVAQAMVFRHGIVAEDGNRDGTRTPKIAEENVARFIDVLRWWASVNDQAQVVRRVPWKEIYEFTNARAAWVMPLKPLNLATFTGGS